MEDLKVKPIKKGRPMSKQNVIKKLLQELDKNNDNKINIQVGKFIVEL